MSNYFPSPPPSRCIVVGAGVFGVSTAISLRQRFLSHNPLSSSTPAPSSSSLLFSSVTLIDTAPLPFPSPLAASNDLNRIVRPDYGTDELYTHLALQAIAGWRRLNREWKEEVYRETGFLLLTSEELEKSKFEFESFQYLSTSQQTQVPSSAPASASSSSSVPHLPLSLTRLSSPEVLQHRFPLWSSRFSDGYLNPCGGWVDNGRALQLHLEHAQRIGVEMQGKRRVVGFIKSKDGKRVVGVKVEEVKEDEKGHMQGTGKVEKMRADLVVLAVGAWTPQLLPELSGTVFSSGQPVIYMSPKLSSPPSSSSDFLSSSSFPVFGADLSTRGFYGFPLSPRSLSTPSHPLHKPFCRCGKCGRRVIKIGHHGTGYVGADPEKFRTVEERLLKQFEAFVREKMPRLDDEYERVDAKLCYYCDSFDGHWLIDYHPTMEGLFVCAGDSGHAFKFLPVMGEVVMRMLRRNEKELSKEELKMTAASRARFRWRLRDPSAVLEKDGCRSSVNIDELAAGAVSKKGGKEKTMEKENTPHVSMHAAQIIEPVHPPLPSKL